MKQGTLFPRSERDLQRLNEMLLRKDVLNDISEFEASSPGEAAVAVVGYIERVYPHRREGADAGCCQEWQDSWTLQG